MRYPESMKQLLFLAAEPKNEVRLRLGQEQREIDAALQRSLARNLKLETKFAVRPADLTQAIHDVEPQIVHFSGHGGSDGALCFEDNEGRSKPVAASALASLFEIVSSQVEC